MKSEAQSVEPAIVLRSERSSFTQAEFQYRIARENPSTEEAEANALRNEKRIASARLAGIARQNRKKRK
jgi:hypothetical protein